MQNERIVLIACLSLAAFPLGCFAAESYLCVGDVGAMVEDGADRPANSILVNVADLKYVLTNNNGNWSVRELGKRYVQFDQCMNSFFCDNSKGYAGVFMRTPDGRFSVTWVAQAEGKRDQLYVSKGRCSRID